MRFYHIITLALAIICLFGESGIGAPTNGRCRSDSKNPHCATQGSLMPLSAHKTQLPPAAKDKVPVSTDEATPEMEEQSGEGLGNSDTNQPLMSNGLVQADKNEEEGSTFGEETSADINYSQYVYPKKIDRLSSKDLKEESMIP